MSIPKKDTQQPYDTEKPIRAVTISIKRAQKQQGWYRRDPLPRFSVLLLLRPHVQCCAPFGVAVSLRQVALNNQTMPLRRVPRTSGGTRLIHQRRR